jgi:nucleoside-diphosphate-sugar epimerase
VEGQTTYGFLKGAFERYLAGVCADGSMQGVALRLEYPGFRSTGPQNLYVSTSIENTIAGFACALRPPQNLRFGAFNLADAHVDPEIVDVQAYVARRWPYARNRVSGNGSLLSTERAQRILGYRPVADGRYVDEALVW